MPRSFRDFEVTDTLLGKGGMASVWLGRQKSLDAPRAMKILYPALADDEEFISRFEREAKAGAALQHPNIVSVFDYGNEDDRYYIVMELVDGIDLKDALEKTNPFPPEIALLILEQVVHGLKAAHALGIWHRDIKPSNILMSKAGEVKIGDFGLARDNRDRDRLARKDRTLPGTVMGTLAYMSPEQHLGRVDELDGRTDMFSLGIMAYELLTGRRPFVGTDSEIRKQACQEDPQSLIEWCPLATPQTEELVFTMLKKDRDQRYRSMDEILQAIRVAMQSLDPDEDVLKYRQEYLSNFSQNPAEFCEELRTNSIRKHLTRGNYLMRQRVDKREEAIHAFRYVLILEPENEEAKLALRKLQKQKLDSVRVGLNQVRVSPQTASAFPGSQHSLTAI